MFYSPVRSQIAYRALAFRKISLTTTSPSDDSFANTLGLNSPGLNELADPRNSTSLSRVFQANSDEIARAHTQQIVNFSFTDMSGTISIYGRQAFPRQLTLPIKNT